MGVLVLCPSRGRPQAAKEALASFLSTRRDDGSHLVFVVDSDDPTKSDYPDGHVWVADPPPGCMNAALNRAAFAPDLVSGYELFGFIGDDHRFRTDGWDVMFLEFAADNPGIYYGNDLFQSHKLPTSWFVTDAIRNQFGLGYPDLRHLYIDNYWMTMGEAADCLYYFPDVVIEHLHPAAGKGEWDDQYRAVNSPAMYGHDGDVYRKWLDTRKDADATVLRGITGA